MNRQIFIDYFSGIESRENTLLVFFFFGLLTSCSSTFGLRNPASKSEVETMIEYYNSEVEQARILIQLNNKRNQAVKNQSSHVYDLQKMSDLQTQTSGLNEKLKELKKANQKRYEELAQSMDTDYPVSVKIPFTTRWRSHYDEFILHELSPYALKGGQPAKIMYVSTDTTKKSVVKLINYVFSWKKNLNAPVDPAISSTDKRVSLAEISVRADFEWSCVG